MTLVIAVGFAVVGIAGAASAHHNTISGKVDCATGGGWAVTWWVTNSESQRSEKIIDSNRPSAVPIGTFIDKGKTGTFYETVTTKPSSGLTLSVKGYWASSNTTVSNSGTIPASKFADNCGTKTVTPPTVPVIDECGPNNATFGTVPTGPWTSKLNPDGSLTITANPGYQFDTRGTKSVTYPKPKDSNVPCPSTQTAPPTVPVVDECGPNNATFGPVPSGPWTSVLNPDGSLTITANTGYEFSNGQTSVTIPAPVDSNVPCPTPPVTPPVETPPVTTPPVTTPPVTTPPEVLPAQVRVVKGAARKLDKCGTRSDMFKVAKRAGVVYTVKGKVVKKGVWIHAKGRKVVVRASAANEAFRLKGQQRWTLTFTNKSCANGPQVAPNTGA
ncbi:hypothetical protein GCM10009797_10220 [Nocardioides hwasunensis]